MEEVHLVILGLTALVILYADHLGFDYLRGKKSTLPPILMNRLHTAVWVGLAGMIVTGLWMAYPRLAYLLTQPQFGLKMCFVLVLVINAIFIGRLMHKATTTPFVALTKGERLTLMISGTLSTVSWLGAATIGMFFL